MVQIEQIDFEKKFLQSEKPFVFDIYVCQDINNLEFIKPFVKSSIHSLQKIEEIDDFELLEIKENVYIYQRTKSVKIGFEYFWNGYLSVEERPLIYHLLSLIPGAIYETNIEQCNIVYHSHFNGNSFSNMNPGIQYIFFSGEKHSFPSEKYDLSISYLPDSKKTVCYPYFFTVLHTYNPRYNLVSFKNQSLDIPKEFCAFIISNPGCPIRNSFFHYVCQNYKQVKSYGRVLNNVGFTLNFPYNDSRQLELLGKHKFVICFENTKIDDYYVTEKILIAKAAGSIPIYWGSKKVLDLFQSNSFLYLQEENIQAFENLLNKIRLIDQSDELYLKIRNTPLLKEDTKINFEKSILKSKMNQILFPVAHPYLQNSPKFYYINLERSKDRKLNMEKLFRKFGITSYERVEAIDGNKIVPKEPRLNIYEEATTLSHLKAIQSFYESGLESAIICEDDLSFEWIELWKTPLQKIINDAPNDCEILQLAYTLYPHNFHYIKQDYNPFLLLTFNGAMAYYITRKVAEKILSQHTYQNPGLGNYKKIRPVSDVLIFDLAKTYTYKYCLFTHPDNNQSTIHDDHLIIHFYSKINARKVFDIL